MGMTEAIKVVKEAPAARSREIGIGLKLLRFAFLYFGFQLGAAYAAKYYFFSSREAGRAIYQLFFWANDITPALRHLHVFYQRSVDGVEFSQVFAVYVLLLVFLLLYFAALFVALYAGLFKNARWRNWMPRDYGLFTLMIGLGLWTFQLFILGPASFDYRSFFFHQEFVDAVCSFVPLGQFVIFVALVLYFTMGAFSGRKPNA
jgi:hypothetical protein